MCSESPESRVLPGFRDTPSLPSKGCRGDVALTAGGASGDGGQGSTCRFFKGPGLQEKMSLKLSKFEAGQQE